MTDKEQKEFEALKERIVKLEKEKGYFTQNTTTISVDYDDSTDKDKSLEIYPSPEELWSDSDCAMIAHIMNEFGLEFYSATVEKEVSEYELRIKPPFTANDIQKWMNAGYEVAKRRDIEDHSFGEYCNGPLHFKAEESIYDDAKRDIVWEFSPIKSRDR